MRSQRSHIVDCFRFGNVCVFACFVPQHTTNHDERQMRQTDYCECFPSRCTTSVSMWDVILSVCLCWCVWVSGAHRTQHVQWFIRKALDIVCWYLFVMQRDKQVHVPCVLDRAKRKPRNKCIEKVSTKPIEER